MCIWKVYSSLISKKGIRNSHISSYLSTNDIINLVSSKVTCVCEIMTCFTNDDIIDLLMTTRHIYFDTKMFVSR